MIRVLKRALGMTGLAVVLAVGVDLATFDRAALRADYARLKRDMAQGYANLDWMRERRGVDLAKLDFETSAAIDGAWSHGQGWRALRRFVDAFGDPHLVLRWRSDGAVAGEAAAAVATSCEAEGYRSEHHGFAPHWATLPGWRVVGATSWNFPAAMMGTTGMIRIAQFGEDAYLEACKRALRSDMSPEALRHATRELLNGELRATLAELRRQGAVRLLVDVSGNGGGSEWVEQVVALMTDRKLTRARPRLVGPACDRSRVWDGRPACPVFAGNEARAEIAGTGGWTGPVLIYANRNSASATEDFIAWLHQNRVAILIGERTLGAGCGYVNGGVTTRLSALPFEIRMPNCARFLDSGVNEIEGQTPDIAIDDSADEEFWAPALAAALSQ